ncbi:aminotransferase class I/II-fold pyridoxal phosphate-dependent enzyme [bacterium]|nr:aminotransferase class I/II-fold pyridoxal phosphate-dependent enzyme [bacterium]
MTRWQQRTLSIHGASSCDSVSLRGPIYRTAAYPLGTGARAKKLFACEEAGLIYSRITNPTVHKLEELLALLEGAEAGLATCSGMAAITLLALHLAHSGGHVVSSNRLYGGTFHLFRETLPTHNIGVDFVENPYVLEAWERAIRPNTRFLYLETPSNPLIEIFGISAIAKIAHKHGLPLVVDSTLATPILLQPLTHGADIVIHSLSKYIGDGKVMGGMILGKKDLINAIRGGRMRDTGPCLSPDSASIFCDNIESLSVRVLEHCENAELVADFLANHSKVRRVFYPTVGTHAANNSVLMRDGFGGLIAFEIKGRKNEGQKKLKKRAITVLENLRRMGPFEHAANLGESRSLVIHPATTTHGQMPAREMEKAGITGGMLRLSIGREDPDDLIDALKRALKKI